MITTSRRKAGTPSQPGFTLIEGLIVVVILGLVAAIAIPTYLNYMVDTRIGAETNNFLVILSQARTEAMNSGQAVSICPSTDGATCNGDHWEDGWIVFVDGGRVGVMDGDDYVVRKGQPVSDKSDLKIDSGGVAFIRFTPSDLRYVQ